MKIRWCFVFLFMAPILVSSIAKSICIGETAKSEIEGKFKVVSVSPLSMACGEPNPDSEDRDLIKFFKTDGCELGVVKSPNETRIFLVYGGAGSCEIKPGAILELRMNNYCCQEGHLRPYRCADDLPFRISGSQNQVDKIYGCGTRGGWYLTGNKNVIQSTEAGRPQPVKVR